MNKLFLIPLLIFLLACTNDKISHKVVKSLDSTIVVSEKHSLYSPVNGFYAVYELSAKTNAIVIDFRETEDGTILDSIFENISLTDSIEYSVYALYETPKNTYYADTIGEYRLLRSDKLEREFKKILPDSFYIYGTKGFVKSKIGNILFGLDECGTNIFALCLDNLDTSVIGHPIIASTKFYKMNIGKSYNIIEKSIKKRQDSMEYDYSDSIKTKVFGNVDSLYFTFNDDFLWGINPSKSNCLFPGRSVYVLQKDKTLKVLWVDGLDLFGIPCD